PEGSGPGTVGLGRVGGREGDRGARRIAAAREPRVASHVLPRASPPPGPGAPASARSEAGGRSRPVAPSQERRVLIRGSPRGGGGKRAGLHRRFPSRGQS